MSLVDEREVKTLNLFHTIYQP